MPKAAFVVVLCLVLSVVAPAQDKPELAMGIENLAADQTAIYRVVLKHYLTDSHEPLNLASTTEPFQEDGREVVDGCIKGFRPETQPDVIHQLTPSTFPGLGITLVDSETQKSEVKENDPETAITKAIDNGNHLSDEELDNAVKKAFESGLFTFSEIVFDKQRVHAMVAYRFVCGGLCGGGKTLALQKVGKRWKIVRTCSSWIS
jgi:hypothetical protein